MQPTRSPLPPARHGARGPVAVALASASAAAVALALSLALPLAACGDHDHKEPGAAAAPEPEPTSYTVFTARYEHFDEHPPLVAGKPARFAAHLTDLDGFEAVASGTLSVVALRKGVEVARSPAVPPARPGIFRPELTVRSPGEVELRVRVERDGADDEAILGEAHVYATEADAARGAAGHDDHDGHGDHDGHDHAEEGEGEKGGDEHGASEQGIVFLKEQQWRLGLRTEVAAKRRVVETVRVPGRVIARPGGRAAVAAPIAGMYAAPPAAASGQGPLAIGAIVESGADLGAITPLLAGSERVQLLVARVGLEASGAEAESALARAQADVQRAERVLARVEQMHTAKAASARELEEARFALELARLDVQARERAAQPLRKALAQRPDASLAVSLAAPIRGTVAAVHVTAGERVEAGQTLYELFDLDLVWVEADIPEADLDRLPAAPEAGWVPAAEPGASTRRSLRFVTLAPAIDEDTRSAHALFAADRAAGPLRLGAAIDVIIDTARAEDALAIPVSALVDEDGSSVVYVQLGGESFARREVTLGLRAAGYVEVRSGLRAGERVASHAAYAVRLQSFATALPEHGHDH